MFVDVWDADSLHLIGTCTLQLKDLLRHGKEAVQSTHELHVLSTEYDDETHTNSADTVRFVVLSFTLYVDDFVVLVLICILFVLVWRWRGILERQPCQDARSAAHPSGQRWLANARPKRFVVVFIFLFNVNMIGHE